MIAQDAGVSSKLAPSPRTVLSVIERYPADRLRPGDVFITKAPWLCCGHLYDISVIKPRFHEGRLVGFGDGLAHVLGVSGRLPNTPRGVSEDGDCLHAGPSVRAGEAI